MCYMCVHVCARAHVCASALGVYQPETVASAEKDLRSQIFTFRRVRKEVRRCSCIVEDEENKAMGSGCSSC